MGEETPEFTSDGWRTGATGNSTLVVIQYLKPFTCRERRKAPGETAPAPGCVVRDRDPEIRSTAPVACAPPPTCRAQGSFRVRRGLRAAPGFSPRRWCLCLRLSA